MTIGDWSKYLSVEKEKEYFRNLYTFLNNRSTFDIYPQRGSWFKAFEYSSFTSTRVIILGQDPYHGEGQAEGLSFSVPKGITIPPSLRNIYKELNSDEVDFSQPEHGNLVSWAQQGVLLLNSVLTVEKNSPAAHANHGWEIFTDEVIRILNDNKQHLVFILWGAYANKKSKLIDLDRHLILSSAHPSPFSAHKGFFGCKHFSQANKYLLSTKQQPIRWSIPK
ncbi:uracil-DNA glycosylase [Candidatus Thioglobus sp. NP1]|uniref:uracil-DNA glycosylase n=1 Tax=Candidatus Thioglobus sp. NP1 TaxID=2508687 RepID=UPI000DEDB594|nr:uracil-DNA glycosylase [Candidatus Thioglobus sp. NP1]AXE61889.1 uracil-DNA glycosylase [Candidatus Thioglobus sp. NP1]